MNILHGVNLTIKSLLEEVYVGNNKDNTINIKIAPPDVTAGDKNVSLFCYRIIENAFSKSHKPELQNFNKIHFPPLILDLYYLITINVDAITDQAAEQISDIQGKILRLFHDNQILHEDKLSSEIKQTSFDNNDKNMQLKIRLNPLSMEELNHIWTLFPSTKYKASLSYIISPVIIPSEKELATTLVKTRTIKYEKK